jgi:predicted NBD/HSP70 family sugar kinase
VKLGEMREDLVSVRPKLRPPLDDSYTPAVLSNRAYQTEVGDAGTPVVIGLEREAGQLSRFETRVFPKDHPSAAFNLHYVERLVKFLLWQRGGHTLYVGGPAAIGEDLRRRYSAQGERRFDFQFMGEQVYERTFRVVACESAEVPAACESERPLGRHLAGCRIGFDLGASDRKVSALIDGRVVYSEEVVWEPRQQSDPEYHYREILTALRTAASKLPRVDSIGGSAAGIYVDNRPMVASLFRGVAPDRFGEVRSLFQRLRDAMGVPLEVINDGDVTALAGSMSLNENGVLGIAMGSSEAAGYVDRNGHLKGWLNELAFAPVDYSPHAPTDEWSGDAGCGAQYLSQQCVFRLAPLVGLPLPAGVTDAEKLESVQERLEAGHAGARRIWETMGIYLGYALAHYADFYPIDHVLILGRCTSGSGGKLILDGAGEVLSTEFPELAGGMHIRLPDERSRRVGQAIAAASLPANAPAG